MLKNLPFLFGLQENQKYNEVIFPSIFESSLPEKSDLLSFGNPIPNNLFDSNQKESKVSWSNQNPMEQFQNKIKKKNSVKLLDPSLLMEAVELYLLRLFNPTISSEQISEKVNQVNINLQDIKCGMCKLGAGTVHRLLSGYIVDYLLIQGGYALCDLYIATVGYNKVTCYGIIKQQWGEFILPTIIKLLEPDQFCSFTYSVCNLDKYQKIDLQEWVFDILKTKPDYVKDNNFINNLYKQEKKNFRTKGREPLKIVLMSDIHLDYDYTPGMSIDCGKPLCCRSDSGFPQNANGGAGNWGNRNCDTSLKLLNNMLKTIREDIKPDIIFWGGDSIPHNLETLTLETNIQIMNNITQVVQDNLSDYKIYSAVGNHDTYPQDDVEFLTPRSNPAFNGWAQSWSKFIQDEEQLKNFYDFGYYSIPLTKLDGKQIGSTETKLITLNTNVCYTNNFGVINMHADPGDQLKWLIDELNSLEQTGGKAIILTHVPNMNECTRQFSRRLHAIFDRFQGVIRWQMTAHDHQEEYNVIKDIYFHEPILMNFIVGSVTPYSSKEPNFNVIYLDPETMLPLDYENYVFELDHANEYDEPIWNMRFNQKEYFEMEDLSPESHLKLSKQIFQNETTCIQYDAYRRVYVPYYPAYSCDFPARQFLYCQTTVGDYDEWEQCFDRNIFYLSGEEAITSVENAIAHDWYLTKADYKKEKEFLQSLKK